MASFIDTALGIPEVEANAGDKISDVAEMKSAAENPRSDRAPKNFAGIPDSPKHRPPCRPLATIESHMLSEQPFSYDLRAVS